MFRQLAQTLTDVLDAHLLMKPLSLWLSLSVWGLALAALQQIGHFLPETAIMAGPVILHGLAGILGFIRRWKEKSISGASVWKWIQICALILVVIIAAHIATSTIKSFPDDVRGWLTDGLLFAINAKLLLDIIEHASALGFHLPVKSIRARLAQYTESGEAKPTQPLQSPVNNA